MRVLCHDCAARKPEAEDTQPSEAEATPSLPLPTVEQVRAEYLEELIADARAKAGAAFAAMCASGEDDDERQRQALESNTMNIVAQALRSIQKEGK
jgi:hypothetical protein